ncbi:MAG: hypothetical protein LBU65_11065 [Planctomycetaceae bacterium]|nr:hypothetical protein [Planctomycetaceae bacterium]
MPESNRSDGFSNRPSRRRLALRLWYVEAWLFAVIFFLGLSLSLVHFVTKIIPLWNSYREYAEQTCTIVTSDIFFAPPNANNSGNDDDSDNGNDYDQHGSMSDDGLSLPSFPFVPQPSDSEAQTHEVKCRLELLIRYTVNGENEPRELRTDGHHTITPELETEFPLKQSDAERLQKQFSVGKDVPCWIAIDDPAVVVLLSNPLEWDWYIQGIMLLVMMFGGGAFWRTLISISISDEQRAARLNKRVVNSEPFPTVPGTSFINDSPGTILAFRLPTDQGQSIRTMALIVFSIFWNAISWSFFVFAFVSWKTNVDLVFAILFCIVFCGFGMVMITLNIQQLLVAFGCGQMFLEISDHPIYPGKRYRLVLMQPGVFRVRQLELSLVCEEVARFRQGTDTVTNNKEVYRQPLFMQTDFETARDVPLQREILLYLPHGAMHSLHCESNEINWKLVLIAKFDGWPDLFRECPVIVRPSPLNRLADEESLE